MTCGNGKERKTEHGYMKNTRRRVGRGGKSTGDGAAAVRGNRQAEREKKKKKATKGNQSGVVKVKHMKTAWKKRKKKEEKK